MNRDSRIIIIAEIAGFIMITAVAWLSFIVNQSSSASSLALFTGTWQEAVVETLFIIPLAILVVTATRRYLRRISRLEMLLNVCSLCKRIEVDGNWNTPEHHMHGNIEDDVATSLCPECYQRFYRDLMIEK